MLVEKYDFSEQDATEMASFLCPLLDFVPEKRPTAAQCLQHSWLTPRPQELSAADELAGDMEVESCRRNSTEAVEKAEVAMGNIALVGGHLEAHGGSAVGTPACTPRLNSGYQEGSPLLR